MPDYILKMHGIRKAFGAVQALVNVNFNIRPGTVHALIGENGAGKSTLMKILAGSLKPDSGTVELDGKMYAPQSPKDAQSKGVSMIYQELNLAPHLTIEENISLGVEQARYGFIQHQYESVQQALKLLGYQQLDLHRRVDKLSIGQQQIVEIARSLFLGSRIIIMDEPTSSLSKDDMQALFKAIKRLKEQGHTLIYISHFLEEIKEIADDFTVLRDGESVATGAVQDTSLDELVTHMVGRTLDEMFPRIEHNPGDTILRVENLFRKQHVKNISFALRSGEILGIAGLIGAGRTELLRCLLGLDAVESGQIHLRHKTISFPCNYSPQMALKNGISLVSENRKDEGLAESLSIRDNVSMSSIKRFSQQFGLLKLKKERQVVIAKANDLALKYNHYLDPVSSLSGGNQQKVALARVLTDGSDILLLDEPTRGIDVRSKVEIYNLIGRLAAGGKGIVMVSSYLPELFGVCDTLAVMHRGRLSPVKPIAGWTEESVMSWATTGK